MIPAWKNTHCPNCRGDEMESRSHRKCKRTEEDCMPIIQLNLHQCTENKIFYTTAPMLFFLFGLWQCFFTSENKLYLRWLVAKCQIPNSQFHIQMKLLPCGQGTKLGPQDKNTNLVSWQIWSYSFSLSTKKFHLQLLLKHITHHPERY